MSTDMAKELSIMANAKNVLVTGGSGYIASYVIAQLLAEGYHVRATIRSLGREPQVRETLSKIAPDLSNLSFYAADLTSDTGWAEAMAGMDYVQHLASPISATLPKNDDELVIPAREGALRALRFGRDAGVKRVVITSSMAAIAYGLDKDPTKPLDETNWTDETHLDTSPYIRSKAIAEKAAWAFMKAEGGTMELTTINPGAVLGPALGSDFSASLLIVQKLMNGDFPACPRIGFAIVDVRDIADLHVRAMTSDKAAGERFMGAGKFMWMEDVAKILHEDMGQEARKVPKGKLPSWLVKILGNFDPVTKSIVYELDRYRPVTSAKAQDVLGWTMRDERISITDTARSLIREGVVRV
jgi:dihydroflavonol-4-reductase